MKYLILILLSFGIFANSSVEAIYLKALKYEEVDANFIKAKQLYSKIISEHVTEQEYVARAMYHIAFISEMYAQKSTAKNYYKMILSKYSKFKGLKYLAMNGLSRLSKSNTIIAPNKFENKKVEKVSAINTSITKKDIIRKGPYDNDKYRHGKIAPLYIIGVGEKISIDFNGIKGLGASDPNVADIKPTTSKLTIIGKKIGFVEIMIKDSNGKENYINVNVIDAVNNKINDLYLIKGENKKIYITNVEKIAADNDNVEISAKEDVISINCKKEGKITLGLMRKDGTKVDVNIIVLKPFDKKRLMVFKVLETKTIKFEDIASISVTNHGIVDVKQEGKDIRITGTSKGKTIVIIYGKDNAQLKLDIEVN